MILVYTDIKLRSIWSWLERVYSVISDFIKEVIAKLGMFLREIQKQRKMRKELKKKQKRTTREKVDI